MQGAQARQRRDAAGFDDGSLGGGWGVGYYDGENCYLDGGEDKPAGLEGFVPRAGRGEEPRAARNEALQARRSEAPQARRSEAPQARRSEAPQARRGEEPRAARRAELRPAPGFDESALAGSRAAAQRFHAGARQARARARAAAERSARPADGGGAPGHRPAGRMPDPAATAKNLPALVKAGDIGRDRHPRQPTVDPVTAVLARGVLLDEVALRKSRARRRRRYMQMLAAVCVFGFFVIYQFSALVSVNSGLLKRRAELAGIESENEASRKGIEQMIDLEDVRLRAESQLGMQKPDRSQIVYIAVPRRDHALVEAPVAESGQQSIAEFIEEQARLLKERLFDGKKPAN